MSNLEEDPPTLLTFLIRKPKSKRNTAAKTHTLPDQQSITVKKDLRQPHPLFSVSAESFAGLIAQYQSYRTSSEASTNASYEHLSYPSNPIGRLANQTSAEQVTIEADGERGEGRGGEGGPGPRIRGTPGLAVVPHTSDKQSIERARPRMAGRRDPPSAWTCKTCASLDRLVPFVAFPRSQIRFLFRPIASGPRGVGSVDGPCLRRLLDRDRSPGRLPGGGREAEIISRKTRKDLRFMTPSVLGLGFESGGSPSLLQCSARLGRLGSISHSDLSYRLAGPMQVLYAGNANISCCVSRPFLVVPFADNAAFACGESNPRYYIRPWCRGTQPFPVPFLSRALANCPIHDRDAHTLTLPPPNSNRAGASQLCTPASLASPSPDRRLVGIEPLQLLACFLQVLLGLHPHVEDGAILAAAYDLAVHAPLTPLALSPQPPEPHFEV